MRLDVVDRDCVKSAALHRIDNFFGCLTYRSGLIHLYAFSRQAPTRRLNQSIQKLIIPLAVFIATGVDSLLAGAGRHRGPRQHCGLMNATHSRRCKRALDRCSEKPATVSDFYRSSVARRILPATTKE